MDDIRSTHDVNQASNSGAQSGWRRRSDHPHRSGSFFGHPTPASKLLLLSLIIASLSITIALAGLAVDTFTGHKSPIKEEQYQAVFVDGEPVAYFGKLRTYNDEFYSLSDVYYVQFLVQPKTEENEDQQDQNNQNAQPTLIKFGNEIHGPEDIMYIKKDSVRVIENLKNDGKVVEAISNYKAGKQ